MKRWAIAAGINIVASIMFISCIHNTIIVTPNDDQKNIEASDQKTEITYINESPKVEVKNDVKPVGQEQTFEGFNLEKVPTINELEPN